MMKTFQLKCGVVNRIPRKNRYTVRVHNTFQENGGMSSDKTRKMLIERREFLKEQMGISFEKMYHVCKKDKKITHNENTDCRVVWDEIEELSWKLHDIQSELGNMYECWDEVSCLEYDI